MHEIGEISVLNRRGWSKDWIIFHLDGKKYERRIWIRHFKGLTRGLFEDMSGCQLTVNWECGRFKQESSVNREALNEVEETITRLYVLGALKDLDPRDIDLYRKARA